ncbi:MAG: serine/threonine-protein kinase [Planctomycetota bacterium]|jgi:serine/threonine protein kinase
MSDSVLQHKLAGYRLVELISRGGVAEVYRAVDPADVTRQVAVKVMLRGRLDDRDLVRAFGAEYDLLEELDDRSVPKVHHHGEINGRPAFVMDYIPGRTLFQMQDGGLPVDPLAAFHAVVKVVAYLHGQRVIHNDLKLENIIVQPNGLLCLVDFGNARRNRVSTAFMQAFKRRRNSVFGTPSCIAPELLRGGKPTYASDCYSLGVIAHYLLASSPPYTEAQVQQRLRGIDIGIAPSLAVRCPAAPGSLVRVVDSCLHADPDRRPEDAGVLRRYLKGQVPRRLTTEGKQGRTRSADAHPALERRS